LCRCPLSAILNAAKNKYDEVIIVKIDVYSDMVCPWCRIGEKNMSAALAEWQTESGQTADVSFHAFQLDPSLPPEGLPFKQTMGAKFGGEANVMPMLQRVTDAGAAVGVDFRFDRVERMPNTFLAHRITTLLPEDRRIPWIEAVMRAYFEDGRDIARQDVLLDIAAGLGQYAAGLSGRLAKGEGSDEVRADLDNGRALGVTGVPFFVIDNKYALSGAYPAAQFLAAFRKIAGE